MTMQKIAQRIAIVSALALAASLSALAQTSNWSIDPAHSTAQFTVRHLGISNVTGNFTKVAGSVVLDEKNIAQSQVSATIDVNSVDTRVEMRDKDLKSPNFFDVEKYPTMEFKSKKIVASGGKLQVIGDLTIHGTTHEVTLDVEGPSPEMTLIFRDDDHQPQGFQPSLQQHPQNRRGDDWRQCQNPDRCGNGEEEVSFIE